ncbi:hypothetical protein Kfla_0119 [Kribbella flavida DSM 17836]|uniref:HEPN domain-containing protein n=1 Tax=Kribbella flavida (strain DSM 17836 / JCM 10339 / NBRC 14399) TaxID=479435 RepID=D2PRR8_KRIFD|nr:hypothetical protein [Kribbella flavida]ADB29248.1 hypothetical protein Kfla_0119 [Kribbella flavida DSM 17836]
MNAAAARASLATLIGEDSLERMPVDRDVVGNLLRQAGNHLRTAGAGLEADDPEGAFQLAYDACRKACLALVMATGLRPKGQSAHVITFEAAAAVAATFGAQRVVIEAADLRFVRHGAEYRAEAVGQADVRDAISIGAELVEALTVAVDKILRSQP